MSWFYLTIAGLFEVAWAFTLKQSDGFSRLGFSLATIVLMAISFSFLAIALKQLPIGTAYAVWTGIGAVGTVIVGVVFLRESKDIAKLFFVGLIVAGIVGLKLTTKT
ncbi:MAG TPA: quaternary ammonium compound efflux SMR transporter SugE [Fimbriimonas sp.]|nr:quaternary ammonium compound efflux SMR transporter SugE [Fimbriimonas sp.]